MRRLFAILFLLLAVCASAVDQVRYVDNVLGSNTNNGEAPGAGNAWKTPGKAADEFINGTSMLVHIKANAGTPYTAEHGANDAIIQVQTKGTFNPVRPFILRGYTTTPGDGGQVTFDCTSNSLSYGVDAHTAGATVFHKWENIIVTGAAINGFKFQTFNRAVNCRATLSGSDGFFGVANTDGINCISDNNGQYGFGSVRRLVFCRAYLNNGIGGNTANWAVGCEFYDNDNASNFGQLHGVVEFVIGCTLDGGNLTDSVGVLDTQYGPVLFNNIIVNHAVGLKSNTYDNHEWGVEDYNLLDNTANRGANWNDPLGANDVIDEDPLFVGANDYRLSSGSPALAAGIDAGVIDGITSTSFIDIGAQQAEASSIVIIID